MPKGNDDSKGSEKTLTQEQVDNIVEERLARERKKFEDYDDLKAQVEELRAAAGEKSKEADEKKSEAEKLAEQIQSLQSRVEDEKKAREAAELESLKAKVAASKGLKDTLANRLTGSTKEELEEDADSILEAIGGKEEPAKPGFGRPKEKLQAGASNEDDEQEITPEKGEEIAESIRKSETF